MGKENIFGLMEITMKVLGNKIKKKDMDLIFMITENYIQERLSLTVFMEKVKSLIRKEK